MDGKIYCLTCTVNNKKYIGQTIKSIKVRANQHKKSSGQAIHHAIKKYGWDNFVIELLEDKIETQNDLNKKEKFWISDLNTVAPNGYNLTDGGKQFKVSEETRQKFIGKNNHFYGKKHTPKTCKKMSESHKGQSPWNKGKRGLQEAWNKGGTHTLEVRKILAQKAIAQFKTKGHPRLGQKHSQETKNRISKSKVGKPGWKWTEEYKNTRLEKTQNTDYKAIKLTRKDVNEIREMYATGDFTQIELGSVYSVHRKTIGRIVNYKAWA